jgi:hypothetical protein
MVMRQTLSAVNILWGTSTQLTAGQRDKGRRWILSRDSRRGAPKSAATFCYIIPISPL